MVRPIWRGATLLDLFEPLELRSRSRGYWSTTLPKVRPWTAISQTRILRPDRRAGPHIEISPGYKAQRETGSAAAYTIVYDE